VGKRCGYDYLANLAIAGRPTRLEVLHWLPAYAFRSAYRQEGLDLSAVISIARDLQTNTSMKSLYMRFYSASAPLTFDKVMLPAYSCAILHTTLEEFEKCQKTGDAVPAGSVPTKYGEQDSNKPTQVVRMVIAGSAALASARLARCGQRTIVRRRR
jgi:hypothetical protein